MKTPKISICIPAYKRAFYLQRLLDSISEQAFKNFEVIITDDSPSDEIEILLQKYQEEFNIVYQRNSSPLGSPENWNAAIRLARGEWIKIMHDDDWFADKNSLEEFANATTENVSFIFSGYNEIDVETGKKDTNIISNVNYRLLKYSPLTLLKENFIGHPSTTLIKNEEDIFYDQSLKWVVDIEFYMRFLNSYKYFFPLRKALINIGINKHQITKQAFRNPEIEIPEVFYLYNKLPDGALKNIFAYDYYWRFIRNLSIRCEEDVKHYAPEVNISEVLKGIIRLQSKWRLSLLKKGVISKILMLSSYLSNYGKL
jgi:glycosyltransferase involved in cell wall biosynthesis